MIKLHIPIIYFYLFSVSVFGQGVIQDKFVNEGNLIIMEGSVLSSSYSFENSISGVFENKGTVYYYADFMNSNLYYPGKNVKNSKVYFMPKNKGKAQIIAGQKLSEFQDVEFNDGGEGQGFELSTDFSVAGLADFKQGVVQIDEDRGNLLFLKGSRVSNASDKSHADGFVEKQGNEEFQYPIGNRGFYRPARISAPEKEKDMYLGRYQYEQDDFLAEKATKSGVIDLVNTKEYWEVKRSDLSTGDILLTLSWDERTTPKELLLTPEKDLHIVRWDSASQMWLDEGGVVDMSKREITTAANVKGYGYFTLGTVKTDLLLEGDVVIYNLVTPDGDGKNDYFLIDNIQKFPNNTVEIYNRWGVKVFDTRNYDSVGNVFKGYSEGRVSLSKNEKLPTGTYFYIVNYEYKDNQGSRMIKKSGYLQLETGK